MNGFVNMHLMASAGIFSAKYNLNIYMENSVKLPHILQVIKKSNIYIGYTKSAMSNPRPSGCMQTS